MEEAGPHTQKSSQHDTIRYYPLSADGENLPHSGGNIPAASSSSLLAEKLRAGGQGRVKTGDIESYDGRYSQHVYGACD